MPGYMICYTNKYKIPFFIDDDDYYIVRDRMWYCDSHGYVATNINKKGVKLHRIINKTPKGMFTDHIDGNTRNNRKNNLRTCTSSQNQRNRKPQKGTSKYKGVDWHKRDKRWRVRIQFNGKGIYVGNFKVEIEAVLAYNAKALELFGEYALLNKLEVKSDESKIQSCCVE